MKPMVSILVPAYRAEKWIFEALGSALAQSWPNKEIIVVVDGLDDKTFDVAKTFEARGVKVIRQANHGASAARNRAFRESRGEFIQYLDADDMIAPDKIEKQMEIFTKCGPDSVVTAKWGKFRRDIRDIIFEKNPLFDDMPPVDFLVTAWENNRMMHPAAWLLPREIGNKAGGWDERLSLNDDGEYFVRVALASREVKFCRDAVSYYRAHFSGSLSGQKTEKAYRSLYLSYELGMQRLLAAENSGRVRKACASVFQRLAYEVYPFHEDIYEKARIKAYELGGSDEKPAGGPLFHVFERIIGWKLARKAQEALYNMGYKKFASWTK